MSKMNGLMYRLMTPGEEAEVCDLISRVFNEFVAPEYTPEGIQEFFKYVKPELLSNRSLVNHFVLVAVVGDKIVGMIEMRDYNHISLLFVDKHFQRQGIARELFQRSLEICRSYKPDLLEISVNSSPYAVPIYEKLSFRQTRSEQTINGIRFMPMTLKLSGWIESQY